jgi:thiamine-monophosphate kinase
MPSSEFAFIESIRRASRADPRVPIGIGDDAALVRTIPAGCLVTVDMLMEGVDFTFPPATARLAGRKSLAVNLSDIAAMGGMPTAAFVSLALPKSRGPEFAAEFQSGLRALADEFDVVIAGGDTNSWDGTLVVSITVLGEPGARPPVRRSGARPGDWIFVTGACGGSIHGRHLTFTPRVKEAAALLAAVDVHAMIDISDGLSADLHHILDESGAGADVEAASIPIHPDTALEATCDPWERALGDGEDFELIFTVSPEDGRRLMRSPPLAMSLARLGTIVEGNARTLSLPDGRVVPLPRCGWEHRLGEDGGA